MRAGEGYCKGRRGQLNIEMTCGLGLGGMERRRDRARVGLLDWGGLGLRFLLGFGTIDVVVVGPGL